MEVDKDRIFDLFDDSQEIQQKVVEQKKLFPVDKNNSYFKLGMFTKLIVNHFVFHAKLEKFLKKEEPAYNVESTREASEYVVFNRAFYYLNQINPLDRDVTFTVLDFNNKILSEALESALLYFEEVEEYEKCAHIYKFQKILKESKR
jgi:hypothetical protein